MPKLLITIPCYNEELILEKSVKKVIEYAEKNLAEYDWKFLIIDNASKDKTYEIACRLRDCDPRIMVDRIMDPGRGVAIRKDWALHGEFDIYSYMDADLATDLKDYAFLVSRIKEGYDLATGSRYLREADIKRNFKREMLSRIYNLIIKIVLGVKFKDAQCGFKAFSCRLVAELMPQTTDPGWFWDTELMILAQRKGYKTLEIPVSWREIRDELRKSKVSHWEEAVRQLKNIYNFYKRSR